MRHRAVRLLLAASVLVAIGAYACPPYVRATSLIVRGAHLGGHIEALANRSAYRVSMPPRRQVPTRSGQVPAQFYVPERTIGDPILVIPGVHSSGIEEPRLIALSQQLAATGFTVMTLALPDLQAYRITPRATDTIEDAAAWLAAQPEYAPGGRIGLVGISFAGGLAVAAAGRDRIKDHLAYVVSFGGHADLPRVMRFLVTGETAPVPGVAVHPPHDYGVAVVLYGLADRGVVPPAQVAALREGIGLFLLASQQTVLEPVEAEQTFARARRYAETLPEPSRTYMTYVNDRAVAPLGAVLEPYLDQLGAGDPALSAARATQVPSAPVYLLHGRDDTVIPAVESVLLADALRRKGVDTHLLLSGLITHAEINQQVPVVETWKLISFWASVLRQ